LHVHEAECDRLGFSASSVLAMQDHEFLAINWLVPNLISVRALESYSRSAVVVCERLCRDPLRTAQSLFQFLDWPVGPETRKVIESSTGLRRSVLGALRSAKNSDFGVFRDRTTRSESWKAQLSDHVKEQISSIACQLPGYGSYWKE
jgi:hypothetical protein